MRIKLKKATLVFFTLFIGWGCSKPPVVQGVQATVTTVETTITTISTGTVKAVDQAALGFGTTGRVARIHTKVGQRVSRAQILAELENADLRAMLEEAEREKQRAEQLFREGLVSQASLDQANRSFEIAKANFEKSVIRAPFAGIVTELTLQVGELAQPTLVSPTAKAPIRVVDLKPRVIRGEIDEVDIGKVRIGSPAKVKVAAATSEVLSGVVTRVVPFVSNTRDQDRTSEIEIAVNTPENLLLPVGASADVEIVINRKSGVLAVPARAVLGNQSQRYVFRYDQGRARKTPVKTGAGNYERVEIESGLRPGDWVLLPSQEVELIDGLKLNLQQKPWP